MMKRLIFLGIFIFLVGCGDSSSETPFSCDQCSDHFKCNTEETTCICNDGYEGDHCENNINECAEIICQNGGNGIDGINSYNCNCVAGYDGDLCENNIDECASITCQNGGSYIDGINDFYCHCLPDYDGDYCQYHASNYFITT